MVRPRIEFSKEELVDICRRHSIRRLSLFGSVLRDDFRPDSDVDMLVEFHPDVPIGFRIFRIEEDLSRLFEGRRVDIVDPKYLNRYLKDRILHSARIEFDADDAER